MRFLGADRSVLMVCTWYIWMPVLFCRAVFLLEFVFSMLRLRHGLVAPCLFCPSVSVHLPSSFKKQLYHIKCLDFCIKKVIFAD